MARTEPLPTPTLGRIWRDPVYWLAFGFGTGLAPKAPGTAGTVAGVPLLLLMQPLPLWAFAAVTAALFVAGVWICAAASRRLGVHDHPGIVWDEIVGLLVALAVAPAHWAWWLAGFIIFRVLDAAKPWPISVVDRRVGGGFGIMLDDLLAGVATLAILLVAELVVGQAIY